MAASTTEPAGAEVTRFRVPEGELIRLRGIVDERFPPGLFLGTTGVIVLDLSGVRRVTSYGILEWRRSIASSPASAIYFLGVPTCVMAQFGMVAQFGGPRGQILSYLAPYRCPSCGGEGERLFDRRLEPDGVVLASPPAMTCLACGGDMEFDDLADLYHQAFAGTAPLQVTAALLAVLSAGDAAARGLKISKTVEDAATVVWLSGVLDVRASFRHVTDGLEGQVVIVTDQVLACDEAGAGALGRLIRGAVGAGCQVWLARCSSAVVEALGARPDSLGPASVVSVESPGACISCGHESSYLVVAPDDLAPRLCCPKCGQPCERDAPRSLLAKLARVRVAAPPAWMPAVLRERPAATQPALRATFGDKYTLVRALGAGGMAEIYLARQRGPAGFDRRVAVKRILPALAREPAFVRMFLAEARLASRLSHPNIVQIHELFEAEGKYYIVMEYVEGQDLGRLFSAARRAGQRMPEECALAVVAGACAGLHAAHTAGDEDGSPMGIVHRDVSPQNVLVGQDGSVKLTDFGIAKAANQLERTRPGVLKGKMSYLAPEVLGGAEPDARADLFAAGILFFECLAGFHPFRRASEFHTCQAIMTEPLPPVASSRPDVSPDADLWLAKATARDPAERFQTAEEMLLGLEHLAARGKPQATARELARWVAGVAATAVQGDDGHALTMPSKTVVDSE